MRILVAHNVPAARTGGMSRIMGYIHDEIVRHGHTVDYLCNEDVPASYNNRWQRFGFPWLVFDRSRRAARGGRPYDIVNVHEPSGAVIALCKRWAGGPRVAATSHGLERLGWAEQLRDGVALKTRVLYPLTSLWQSDLTGRLADHVFCLNHRDRDYLIAHCGRTPDSVTRMYPAAEPIYGRAASTRDYARFRRLLFAGTWIVRKGIDEAAAAFTALAARHPSLEFHVLGGHFSLDVIRERFPAELRSRVGATYAANDDENAAAYEAADAMLLPSRFEGTPLTLMESMASGLPVITTATCGMKDVVEDGRNGILVPVRSPESIVGAVERLAASAELRVQLGRAAHQDAVCKYTWEESAKVVEAAYLRMALR